MQRARERVAFVAGGGIDDRRGAGTKKETARGVKIPHFFHLHQLSSLIIFTLVPVLNGLRFEHCCLVYYVLNIYLVGNPVIAG